MNADNQSSERRINADRRKRWLFRFGAMAIGLSFFGLLEILCWIFDWGRPQDGEDPFVGFAETHPLFVLDDEGTRYQVASSKTKFFAKDSFEANKPKNSLRVFCLGGSTVQGRPFSIATSFTEWTQIGLDCVEPHRTHKVVNCGGISYASYRLIPILKECLDYSPDLFVICTGHNEFLEDRTYGDVRDTSLLVTVPHHFLAGFRSYHVYRDIVLRLAGERTEAKPTFEMTQDVDAFLDYRRGLAAYHRDPEWRNGVILHFRYNLQKMMQIAQQNHIPVVLILPPSNLADSPPFKSEHKAGFNQTKKWETLVAQARQASQVSAFEAIHFLEQSLELDDQFAMVHFQLGKLYERTEQFEKARLAFVAARDNDICPLRILSPMEKIVREVAQEWEVPLIDANSVLSSDGAVYLDGKKLVDHVHPSIQGHQEIGLALVEQLIKNEAVPNPKSNWHAIARSAFKLHYDHLPPIYFERGRNNLENLRAWTRGDVDAEDVSRRFPERVKEAESAR